MSDFINFIRDLQLSKAHVNLLVFKLLSENSVKLEITKLVRQFCQTNDNSDFSKELKVVMDFYVSRVLRKKATIERLDITFDMYNRLVPYSLLCDELIDKFLNFPKKAYDSDGRKNKQFIYNYNKNLENQKSCLYEQG